MSYDLDVIFRSGLACAVFIRLICVCFLPLICDFTFAFYSVYPFIL